MNGLRVVVVHTDNSGCSIALLEKDDLLFDEPLPIEIDVENQMWWPKDLARQTDICRFGEIRRTTNTREETGAVVAVIDVTNQTHCTTIIEDQMQRVSKILSFEQRVASR